jgi:hypothetical protein
MSGAIPPLPQYAFMEWRSVTSTGTTLSLLPCIIPRRKREREMTNLTVSAEPSGVRGYELRGCILTAENRRQRKRPRNAEV